MSNQKLDLTNSMYNTLESAKYHLSEMADGDMIYVEDESCIYIKEDNDFRRLEGGLNLQMSQYDINKNIYSQMPVKTDEELVGLASIINDFYATHREERSMLLCRELNYYTIFELDKDDGEFGTLADAVIACVEDWGKILDVVPVDGAIEIWNKLNETGEAVVMYLFPCEQMFVRHRG